MNPRKHSATCFLCHETLGKKGVQRHLQDCLDQTGWPEAPSPSYVISIDGRHDPSFWMVVVAQHDATFCDLDILIKDVWIGDEDEDDYSSFTIQGTTHIDAATNKFVSLADRIEEGQIFYYTHTSISALKEVELRLRVVGTTPVMPPENQCCCVVARNTSELPPCVICGDKSEFLAIVPEYGFEFKDDYEDNGCKYYCRDCLKKFDSAAIFPYPNSPRKNACFTLDAMDASLYKYPPGCELSELISEDMQKILVQIDVPFEYVSLSELLVNRDPLVKMEGLAREDIGAEIDGFLIKERESGKDVCLSEKIVVPSCSLMYGVYEIGIDHWNAALLTRMLLETMVRNPDATYEGWAEQFVSVLCRFLEYAEHEGRNVNAREFSPALLEAEPEFIQRVAAYRQGKDIDRLY